MSGRLQYSGLHAVGRDARKGSVMATKPTDAVNTTHRDAFPPLDDASKRRLVDMSADERSRTVRAEAGRIADERRDLLDRLSQR